MAAKREQRLQDVPQSVQVLNPQVLQSGAVRSFEDLTRVAPSLIVRPAEHPANATVSIRGVGTFAFSIGVEPSVVVQVDDVPQVFQPRAFTDLADVQRIEVLRGPQSTLYGRAASAGVVNVYTKDPTSELSGRVAAIATDDHEYGASAALSGPIANNLGFRLSANYDNFEGNIDNLATHEKVNGREQFSTRGKLVWDPSAQLRITLDTDFVVGSTTVGRPFIAVDPAANLRNNPAFTPLVWNPGVVFNRDNTSVYNDLTGATKYNGFGQSIHVSYDLGFASLVSITGHDHFKLRDYLDVDESAIPTFNNPQIGQFDEDQWTEELRLVSPSNQPFRYTLGAFYADVGYLRDFGRGPFFSIARWFATSGSKQQSLFGQIDWDFVPTWTAIAGARVSREDIDYTFRDLTVAVPVQNVSGSFANSDSEDFSTYKLGLEHHFSDDVMMFLTYSTAHKGQSYDLTTGFNLNRFKAGPVRPETSDDWQLGARTQFFNRALTLNATLFDTIYQDFQAQGIETLPDGTTNFRLTNVGEIEVKGLEVEAFGRFNSDWSYSGSATYLDANINEFLGAQCWPGQTAAQGCVGSPARQNLTGKRPPLTPDWKLTANLDYAHPIQGSLDATFGLAYVYQTKFNVSLNQDPLTVQDAYGILNLTAGIRNHEQGYEITAFVNNALDEHYFTNFADSFGNYGNHLALQAYLPRDFGRYFGVRASYDF